MYDFLNWNRYIMTDTGNREIGTKAIGQVDYGVLDAAKAQFISAAKSTLGFASEFGTVPQGGLGASANVFQLNLEQLFTSGGGELGISLISEGLGTADDARPADLSESESREFWYNIGIKTVACLSNDAASSALQSLLLSLYLPSSTPETVFNPLFMEGFTKGIVDGCRTVGCVYLSGETPQLKTKIYPDKIDIAGAVMALAIPGLPKVALSEFGVGNQIVFIASSGPHENGFTPIRELATRLPRGLRTLLPSGVELWRAANAPTVLYTPLVRKVLEAGIAPTGLENISGHGWQKIMRSKQTLSYVITNPLPFLDVFSFIQNSLEITLHEMLEIFNCGVGFAIFVRSADEAQTVVNIARTLGLVAVHAGHVESSSSRKVIVEPWNVELGSEAFTLSR
jgi:phosphoribosylformylglycinamidine cyclo-ligase